MATSTHIYKFGNYYLDTVKRRVFNDKRHLNTSSKAFDILHLLIERQGKAVTKEEILKNVWEDSFVEEGNLTVYVSELRKLLSADKSESFIETVFGVGYRFVSIVEKITEEDWRIFTSNDEETAKISQTNSIKPDSIAVLPLKNENGDEDMNYLADGITESLINNLSYIPNLRVIARNTVFRYKDLDVDFQEIGKELNVTNILTGRIRIIHKNLVISVELTNTEDGTQIWGTQLNQPFENIFDVQEQITQAISEKLKTRIGNKEENLTQRHTKNTESYRLYLKGKYFQNRQSIKNIKKAIDCFQESIANEPTNALAYIELANCFMILYFYDHKLHEEAVTSISSLLKKVFELDPNIADYYVIKGNLNMSFKYNFQEAERNFKKALQLNPNLSEGYYYYAKLLCFLGRFSEGLKEIDQMIKLDPISLQANKNVSRVFLMVGQHENAITLLNECLDLHPIDNESLLLLGTNLTELERYEEALDAFYKALDIQFHFETLTMIAYAKIRDNKIEEGKEILNQLIEKSKKTYVPSTYISIIYATLNNNDLAFEFLTDAYNQNNSSLTALKVDWRYKSIRHDPRFNEMLRKIGLPTD